MFSFSFLMPQQVRQGTGKPMFYHVPIQFKAIVVSAESDRGFRG
jgi:hypothetical protein